MAVDSGNPINALRSALDAYTAAQDAVIAEAHKLKDPAPTVTPSNDDAHEGGTPRAVSPGY